ncbi:MAG: molybdopterin-dependent oxidoreductase, partial [Alphaproteobacteria bacterium]
ELGNDIAILNEIFNGNHEFAKEIENAKNPMIVIGTSVLNREDTDNILKLINQICKKYKIIREDWNGYNILHKVASRVAGLDLKFTMGDKNINDIFNKIQNKEVEVVYLLAADEIDMNNLGEAFVIYQGHHGDKGAHRADVIFPGAAYTEKNAIYVNLEGRIQKTMLAVPPPGEAREDWKIVKELANYLTVELPYNSLSEVRKKMAEEYKSFQGTDETVLEEWNYQGETVILDSSKIIFANFNYYMTDPISRCSKIMADCSNLKNKKVA